MKKYIVPALLPFVIQCGSGKSKSENQPLATNVVGEIPSGSAQTPSAPLPATPASAVPPAAPVLDTSLSTALTVNFLAKVGAEDLACNDKTDALLQRGQIFTDLRFFVSNLVLVDEQGQTFPVKLDVDANSSNLQYVDQNQNSIALLNFLEAGCASSDATKKIKTSIEGLLNQGIYKELRFQLGLPYAPMDEALTSVPSALAPSDMGWMWQHYPADIQIEMHTGKAKKMLNALTSENKRTISLPISLVHSAESQKVDLTLDLSKLFPSSGAAFVSSVESACNNSTKTMTENTPNCAHAFKALGLEVANAKQPYEQNAFSIVK
jgi:hypothetical protein